MLGLHCREQFKRLRSRLVEVCGASDLELDGSAVDHPVDHGQGRIGRSSWHEAWYGGVAHAADGRQGREARGRQREKGQVWWQSVTMQREQKW